MVNVLVTGAAGQLGQCLNKLAGNYSGLSLDFRDKSKLDITNFLQLKEVFEKGNYKYCINTAAYTDVEGAEQHPDRAYALNSLAVKDLAGLCHKHAVCLLHLSTDYVFDGEKDGPYTTSDTPNPINIYGRSKWEGEKHIQAEMNAYFIIRTSWLYSEFGTNFYTKILKMSKSGATLRVTDAQIGCPTNANNLAKFVLDIIAAKREDYGIYHFCDAEPMSWYQFALRILRENNLSESVKLVRDNNYRSFAARPRNSVLKG